MIFALDHQIVADEVCRIAVIGMNTAHPRGGQYHMVDAVTLKEIPHGKLLGEIQLGMAGSENVPVSCLAQAAHNDGTHHTPVAGDIDG